jgi:epoxyqueuosine reductase
MSHELADRLKARARALGFHRVGITTPEATAHMDFYRNWLAEGRHGEMAYLARPDVVARRGDLTGTMEGVRSIVVVAQEYFAEDPEGVPEDPARGVIARYARGRDYHEVMGESLSDLGVWLEAEARETVAVRAYVDTGPILERDLGRRAGLGWFGKNTMLIHPTRGSYFFLGVLLSDLALPPDPQFEAEHCGSCTRCLEACPTGALSGYRADGAPVMDARRCISYLTIELRGAIPRDLRPLMGNRVFGCDICQEVCPFTRKFSVASSESTYAPTPELDGLPLLELAERLLAMSGKGFTRAFAGSPVLRAGRKGLLRNVCVALGNWGSDDAVGTLAAALADPAALVRGHAAWALGRIGSGEATRALSVRLDVEDDEWARGEISAALGG